MPLNSDPAQAPMERMRRDWERFGREGRLARYIIVHWIVGAGTGVFCAALLLALNPLGLRSLLFRSDALIVGLVLLFSGFATLFGGVVCAAAVMFPRSDEAVGGRGEPGAAPRRAPVARLH